MSSQKGLNTPEKIEKQVKVLIVEDNAFNIVPIKTTLDRHHIEYDIAKNGLMAVDRYNQMMSEGYFLAL